MRYFFPFCILLFYCLSGFAQTPITMGSGSNSQTGCNFLIYDDGGNNGNYSNNRNDVLTLYSNNTAASSVQISVDLSSFNVHPSDTLYVYDGNSTSAPLLGKLNDSLVASNTSASMVFTASITNTSGALTLRFKTNGSQVGTGFIITSTCVAPCQRVSVEIDPQHSSHNITLEPDGFYYMNVCSYDTVHFVVKGIYPDNGFSYNQSDATTRFSWNLGLDMYDSVGLHTVDYQFSSGRGYDVSISATDVAGCTSINPLMFRVRTSRSPIIHLKDIGPVCTEDEMDVTFGYQSFSTVQMEVVESQQEAVLRVQDTIFLPDGVNCGSGCAYQSPVTFNAFSPTDSIRSADDILYLRVKMEHSYVGDLYIGLTCPTGKSVKIMNKYGSSGSASCAGTIPLPWGWLQSSGVKADAHFGVIGYANNSGYKCDSEKNPIGTTWNYCWSNNTNPAYGYSYARGLGHVYESVNMHNGIIDSTNTVNMSQVYHPDESFSKLIGCPLNGTWAITVIDGWSGDNGYITEWELALDSTLLPETWEYVVNTDSTFVTGAGADRYHIRFPVSGQQPYTFNAVDEYGCLYDTTVLVMVAQSPKPHLGDDIFLCEGEIAILTADSVPPGASFHWNTGAKTQSIQAVSEGDYSVTANTFNSDFNIVCHGKDTVHVTSVPMPEIDFDVSDSSGCAPLVVRITNHSIPENSTCKWTIYDGHGVMVQTSTLREPTFSLENSGKYSLTLTITTPYGCQDSLYRWNYFNVDDQPIAEFLADPDISMMSENDGEVKFINYADPYMFSIGSHFQWDFGDGETDTTNFSNTTHTYAQWGDYNVTLSITTPSGCSSEITHLVTVEQDLRFPNIITPNGDQVNDVFAIENLNTNINPEDPDEYRTNKLVIFDRWGNIVYNAKNYDTFARDGQIELGTQYFDGTNLSDGVYYYHFYYKGKAKTIHFHGSLTILR